MLHTEVLTLPYAENGVMFNIEITVENGKVKIDPLLRLLHIKRANLEGVDSQRRISTDALQAWLTAQRPSRSKRPELLRHFQQHLVALVLDKSLALLVKQHEPQPESKNIEVFESLEGTDVFRRDASHGRHRIPAEVIDHSVHTGTLDLFVRAEDTVWGSSQEYEHTLVVIDDASYRNRILQDIRRAHTDVLTGQELTSAGLALPKSFERTTIPAREVVVDNRIITVPAHPRILPWERAIMQGKKNAEDVELPGSPYHKQLPPWFGL